MPIKEKILDFLNNVYLCLLFLRICFVAVIQKTFTIQYPKKNIKKVRFSPLIDQINDLKKTKSNTIHD